MNYKFIQGGDERGRSEVPTTWIMRQFLINQPEMSELVLCQIYDCNVVDLYAHICQETLKRRRELGLEDDDGADDDDDDDENLVVKRFYSTWLLRYHRFLVIYQKLRLIYQILLLMCGK